MYYRDEKREKKASISETGTWHNIKETKRGLDINDVKASAFLPVLSANRYSTHRWLNTSIDDG